MALKLSVKIGTITNLSDARYAAGMGVDYIGFNLDTGSINLVAPETVKKIMDWISGIEIIGEIGNSQPKDIDQFPPYITETSNINFTPISESIILRIDAEKLSNVLLEKQMNIRKNIVFFLLRVSAKQLKDNITFFTKLCSVYPVFFSTDFNEDILEILLSHIKPKGIEIKGSLEDKVGFKDYNNIANILEWLEVDS